MEPMQHVSGPKDAKILLIGEAWGADEDMVKRPFVGEAGKELFRMLGEAWGSNSQTYYEMMKSSDRSSGWWKEREDWLVEQSCALTNVFSFRPPENKIDEICCKKAETGVGYTHSSIRQGAYIKPEFLPHLDRLEEEISIIKPNLLVALGATALWALTGKSNIGTTRGAITPLEEKPKLLPTYHPANVLYNWSNRTIVLADFIKAKREAQFSEIRRPFREIEIYAGTNLDELERWCQEARGAKFIAADVETAKGMITCLSIARSRQDIVVVPFSKTKDGCGNYWPTKFHEVKVWRILKSLFESEVPKLFQNGLYDLQYIMRTGILPQNCLEDSMLLHHSLYPELPKGLGFLGSIYSSEPAWKLMRLGKADTEKRDE